MALLARRTTADIIHVLSLRSTSLDEVANVLFHALTIVETQPKGRHTILTYQTLGTALEVYRYANSIDRACRYSCSPEIEAGERKIKVKRRH